MIQLKLRFLDDFVKAYTTELQEVSILWKQDKQMLCYSARKWKKC